MMGEDADEEKDEGEKDEGEKPEKGAINLL